MSISQSRAMRSAFARAWRAPRRHRSCSRPVRHCDRLLRRWRADRFVTARRESYASPGALPSVEHAALRDDLHRRDFTVNAMAASLATDDFGQLFDPFGGRSDLARARSACSTRARSSTIRRASSAASATRTATASHGSRDDGAGARLRRARPRRRSRPRGSATSSSSCSKRTRRSTTPLERLRELDLTGEIQPGLEADAVTAQVIHRGRRSRRSSASMSPSWRLGLAALARNVELGPLRAWLDRLKIRPPGRGADRGGRGHGAYGSSRQGPSTPPLPPTSSRSPTRAPPTGRCSHSHWTTCRLSGATSPTSAISSPRSPEQTSPSSASPSRLASARSCESSGDASSTESSRDRDESSKRRGADRRAMSDPVETVRRGYDAIADAYLAWNGRGGA